jgi:hypothetical protein
MSTRARRVLLATTILFVAFSFAYGEGGPELRLVDDLVVGRRSAPPRFALVLAAVAVALVTPDLRALRRD